MGQTWRRLPTYKVTRRVMFTNVLLEMLIILLLLRLLRMKADYQVNEEICISALERDW